MRLVLKAKRMPVGTVSRGRKKVAEGKWVSVKKETTTPKSDARTLRILREKAAQKKSGGTLKAQDEAAASGAIANFIIARKAGNIKDAKQMYVRAKKATGLSDKKFRGYALQYGDPDEPGQHEIVLKKWMEHFNRAAKA